MLRDYLYTENWRLLDQALELFIDLPPRLSLIGFDNLSPDSFVWKIYDGSSVYYLYAEDYVPGLEHVRKEIHAFWPHDIQLEFLPARTLVAFEDSSPNQHAETYQPPRDEYKFAEYSAQSGYDFVFLLQSNEKLEDAD